VFSISITILLQSFVGLCPDIAVVRRGGGGGGADFLAFATEGRFLRHVFFPLLVLVSPLLPGWRILPLGGFFR